MLRKSLAVALILLVVTPAYPQQDIISQADAQSIRTVIENQLAAFADDDAEAAFAFASESIRTTFGTAAYFLAMVKARYPVVYRPSTVLFLDPQKVADEIMQSVEMADEDGRLWLALYRMERQPDNTWRINGCVLKSMPGSRM
jgi:hypothetical protein